jgi:hypothetical protein
MLSRIIVIYWKIKVMYAASEIHGRVERSRRSCQGL